MNPMSIQTQVILDPRALFPSDRAGGEKALALAAHLLDAGWLMNVRPCVKVRSPFFSVCFRCPTSYERAQNTRLHC